MNEINKILDYAEWEERTWERFLANMGNYKRKTSLFHDFSVAECFGSEAIRQVFDAAIKKLLNNVELVTELVMVVNHKAGEWDARCDDAYSKLYAELYYEADERFNANYEHDEKALEYYFQVTD